MTGPWVELGEVVAAVDKDSAKIFALRSASPCIAVGVLDPQLAIDVVSAPDGSVVASTKIVLVGVNLGIAIVKDGEGGPFSFVQVLSQGLLLEKGIQEAAKPRMSCGVTAHSMEASIRVVAKYVPPECSGGMSAVGPTAVVGLAVLVRGLQLAACWQVSVSWQPTLHHVVQVLQEVVRPFPQGTPQKTAGGTSSSSPRGWRGRSRYGFPR